MSQVSLSRSSLSLDNMRKSMVIDRSFVAVQAMPKPHPLVLQQLQKLSPLQVPIQLTNRPNEAPFKYSNGVYFGGYENGLRSGCGTFVFTSDGTLYEGTWENDTMSGYGRLVKHNSYY